MDKPTASKSRTDYDTHTHEERINCELENGGSGGAGYRQTHEQEKGATLKNAWLQDVVRDERERYWVKEGGGRCVLEVDTGRDSWLVSLDVFVKAQHLSME